MSARVRNAALNLWLWCRFCIFGAAYFLFLG